MRAYGYRVGGMIVLCAAWVFVGVATVAPVARSQAENEDVKRAIQAELDQSAKCLCSKDMEGYGKVLSTDYHRTDIFGDTTDRDKALATLKTMVEPAGNLSVAATVEGINVKGDQATVLVRTKGSAETKLDNGKEEPVQWDQREVQIWTKTPDGWRLQNSMGLTQGITVSGKPYIPITSDQVAAARTSIQSVYNELVRAMVAGNEDTFAKLIPDDFAYYPLKSGARQSRDEFMAAMTKQFEHKGGTADFRLGPAQLKGDDTAVVLGTLQIQHPERVGTDMVKTTTTVYERDVWKKTDKGWVPVEFHPLYLERSVGGKVDPAIYAMPYRTG